MQANEILTYAPAEKREILIAALSMLPGANYRLEWKREMKVRKGVIAHCVKVVSALVRIGVNYDAMASVQAKREDGTLPAVNAGLPWGEWLLFPRVIGHKGKLYLRFSRPSFNAAIAAAFYCDGVNVSKESLRELCLASEFNEREETDCFTLKLETLESLRIE